MTEQSTPSRSGLGLRIALVLSLAMNLLIVGLIVGVVFGMGRMHRIGPDGPPALRSMGLGPVSLALTRDEREELRGRIEDRRPTLGQDSRDFGRAILEFTAALRAEEFDRAAAGAALAAQRENGQALQAQGHEILLDQLQAMTPEARAAVADRIERSLRRVLDRGRMGHPDGDD
ncbi:periplasmic heavy metal sensor [Rhodobacterales bacterium HKCCE3408]|nr:periplasmic heavy metal sensor [Rhodobacterales bacterium HKCCE3408]